MRIGVDLGGTKIEIIALSDSGDECYRKRISTTREYAAILKDITQLVLEAEAQLGQKGSVGVAIPGTLSPKTGRIKNANSTWLNGQAFDKDLGICLNREIRAVNDANCTAASEAIDGAGAGYHVVAAFILGTGSGTGIAIDGKPHCGGNAIGGEWGHNQLPWLDAEEYHTLSIMPNCYCGKKGCIEQFLSGTGLCDDYFRRTQLRLTGKEIVTRSLEGDPHAEITLKTYERRLAKSLAAYVNILDPDIIVLAGGVCHIERLYQNVPPLIPEYIIGGEFETPIVKAQHGDSSGVRGAAWLWD